MTSPRSMAAQYASAEISRGARAGRAKQGVFALQRSGHGSVAGIAGSALQAVSDTVSYYVVRTTSGQLKFINWSHRRGRGLGA